MLGNKGDDPERASTIAFQRLELMHPPNELGPAFSESSAFFWREFVFVFGCAGVVGAERLKGEALVFAVGPRFRRIGPEISHAVCSRRWDLCDDSRQKLEYVESLALGMREQRVVMGAFALVEQCLGTRGPMNAREAHGAPK